MQKRFAYSIVLLAVAGAAFLTGSWRGPRETAVAAASIAPRAILDYRCPMHPDVRSSGPGTSPCCGMAFQPPYDDAGAHDAADGADAIAAGVMKQQLLGVQ